ncbi:MAG: rhodanese-like domain-containing protein [Balneolaceae bacterium]
MSFTLNQKLAAFAFFISLLAMITSLILPQEAEENETSQVDYFSVLELAQDIRGKENISVIDLRPASDFEKFNIPSSINLTLSELLDFETPRHSSLILYSDNDTQSEQAYFMLKGLGKTQHFVLKGGVEDWYDYILYPKLPKAVTDSNQMLVSKIKALTSFFGGRIEFIDDAEILEYYLEKPVNNNHKGPKKVVKNLERMGC